VTACEAKAVFWTACRACLQGCAKERALLWKAGYHAVFHSMTWLQLCKCLRNPMPGGNSKSLRMQHEEPQGAGHAFLTHAAGLLVCMLQGACGAEVESS